MSRWYIDEIAFQTAKDLKRYAQGAFRTASADHELTEEKRFEFQVIAKKIELIADYVIRDLEQEHDTAEVAQ